jgi:thiol-disulfide isomerase/thioredoxin
MRRAFLVCLAAASVALPACGDDATGDANPTAGNGGDVDLGGGDVGSATLSGLGDGAAPVDLARSRGRPLVVNFFASTCAPCVREMPALERVHQAAGGEVDLVGVAVNDRADAALELVADTGVTYAVAADPGGEYFTAAGATLLPTTLVIDGDGEVVRRLTGEITAEELVAVLADELGTEVVLA